MVVPSGIKRLRFNNPVRIDDKRIIHIVIPFFISIQNDENISIS